MTTGLPLIRFPTRRFGCRARSPSPTSHPPVRSNRKRRRGEATASINDLCKCCHAVCTCWFYKIKQNSKQHRYQRSQTGKNTSFYFLFKRFHVFPTGFFRRFSFSYKQVFISQN